MCMLCMYPNPENQIIRNQLPVPGLFKLDGVEYEKESVQSKELKH